MPHREKPRRAPLAAGQRVFDRFYLKRGLGEGGTGVVWLAHDRVLEQEVALKFLADHLIHDRKAVERLKHETRRNLKLSHPNIVRIHDFLQDASSAAIMMEYVEGWSLWTMKVDKPNQIFPLEEIKPWLRQLFDALDYAHHHAGIVHRDVKPGNLMLNGRGQLKITDFGLARNIRKSKSRDFVDLRVIGTDVYMSPQQWSGEEPTVTDDIYSIGATIYELLTGKPPFYQGNIIDQVYDATPPSMTERLEELGVQGVEIPKEFETTVAACLSKIPEERPGSVTLVAAGLGLVEIFSPKLPEVEMEKAVETPIAEIQFESDPEPVAETMQILESEASPVSEPMEPSVATMDETPVAKTNRKPLRFAAMICVGLLVVWAVMHRIRSGAALPKPGQTWENSIGMKFVPVPGVAGLLSIWETRVQDFRTYVAEAATEPGGQMLSLDNSGSWKEAGYSWNNPEYPQTATHPVVGINWREAMAFCNWLTIRERTMGRLTTNQSYRLPTSAEWTLAAGTNRFVWGTNWPPEKSAGNFAGEEIRGRLPSHSFIAGYQDGFSGTSPVGSFKSNGYGIFDLSGNVAEFCADRDDSDRARRRWLVGSSWQDSMDKDFAIETSRSHIREVRRVSDCGFRVILEFRNQAGSRTTFD